MVGLTIKRIELTDIASPIEETSNNTTNIKSFHYLEDGSIDFSIMATRFSTKKLNSGVYDLRVMQTNSGAQISLKVNNTEENFNQDISFYFDDKLVKIYKSFFDANIKQKINTLGYNHKLGVILYGKQGTGKTSMFKKYFKQAVVENGAIVFNITHFDNFGSMWDFIKDIRKIQDNPIVLFLDECEGLFSYNYDQEAAVKKALDGFDSIDNCLFMMATNYIDKVPETIKNRPSRVKYCIEVNGLEDEKVIGKFLKDSFDKVELDYDFSKEVKDMKGQTLDELKTYVLDRIMDIEPSVNEKPNKVGFK